MSNKYNNNHTHHRRCQLACLAFSLVVTLCTAEALVPNPIAFFSFRGGESRAAATAATTNVNIDNQNQNHKSYKFSSTSLKGYMGDETVGDDQQANGAAASSPSPSSANGAADSSQSVKQIRVTAKGGLGAATRMPPVVNKNGNSSNNKNKNKKNGFASKNIPTEEFIAETGDLSSEFEDRPIPAEFIAETALPTDVGAFRLRAYRTDVIANGNEYSGREPSVIYAADKSPFGVEGKLRNDVPIRIHDQCLTSEVFRSRRCDCSQQLKMALKHVAEHGGAIIYLQQEGRGIGLANKVAAYALQDVGMDTVDANLHLGFPADCRYYGAVPSILHDMKIGSIQLMTNNPRKVDKLRSLGVKVQNTLPMVVPTTNPYNHRYLEAKHDRMDHQNLKHLFVDVDHDDEVTTTTASTAVVADAVVGEAFVTEGEEMAANAIKVSLTTTLDVVDVDVDIDNAEEEGCLARDDGYCFGRQSVEDAIAATAAGKMVVVVDDMNRENEGDLIMAADACTPEDMAFIVRYSSGVICIAMDGERMDKLKLPQMLSNNEDPKSTAFTVTVDATTEHGITTGISSTDRAKTMNLLANMESTATDFARPGHIFPLRAREGGVLTRDGHTEAGVDLAHLAGRSRAGVLCEIVSEDHPTEMMRLPEMKRFCKQHRLVLTSIVDLVQYRKDTEEFGI